MNRFACILATGLLITTTTLVRAESDFQFSGFGTVGLSYENHDDIGFLRDSNQSKDPDTDLSFLTDSILGTQVSYRFSPEWRATTQFVIADSADYDLDSATELAFIGYNPMSDLDIRLGRTAVDMFQLSDYRRVDYVNLWIRPPTELYAWILPTSIDGGDIAKSFIQGDFFWRIKAQFGRTSPTLDSPDGSQQFPTEFNDFLVTTLTLDFSSWRTRLSYAQFKTAASTPGFVTALQGIASVPGPVGNEAAALAGALANSSAATVRYWQAAVSFDNGDWLVDAEIARLSSPTVLVPQGSAGYVSVGYRFPHVIPYLVGAKFFPDKEPFISQADWTVIPGIVNLRNAALGVLNGPLIDQHTVSSGVRWDVAPKVALKAQWDRTFIEANTYALWAFRESRSQQSSTIDVFSLALNFIF